MFTVLISVVLINPNETWCLECHDWQLSLPHGGVRLVEGWELDTAFPPPDLERSHLTWRTWRHISRLYQSWMIHLGIKCQHGAQKYEKVLTLLNETILIDANLMTSSRAKVCGCVVLKPPLDGSVFLWFSHSNISWDINKWALIPNGDIYSRCFSWGAPFTSNNSVVLKATQC